VTAGKIKPEHRDAIINVVKKRESSMSTGIGFGIGLPHASTDSHLRCRRGFRALEKGG
jgi:mannitol/fructose-specific phosphotransferase system IIA component (Ntr-type)